MQIRSFSPVCDANLRYWNALSYSLFISSSDNFLFRAVAILSGEMARSLKIFLSLYKNSSDFLKSF